MRGSIFLLMVTVALAACSGEIRQTSVNPDPNTYNDFVYAAGGRDMTTVVAGNPFAMPQAALERAVTDAMQGHNRGPRTHFTARPSENAVPGYRVVVMFDPPRNTLNDRLCDSLEALQPAPGGGRLSMAMAFCVGDEMMNAVRSSIPAVSSPAAPSFQRMMANATQVLVPRRSLLEDEDNPLLIVP